MNLPTWYSTGSVSVESGSTTVTGSGALWGTGGTDDNIMVGDLFSVPSQPMVPAIPVASVSTGGELELLWPWPGVDVTAQPYIIRYVGIIERSTRANRMALERMAEVSAWYDVIVDTDADRLALETAGSPLRAGYRVLVRTPGVIWAKETGAYGDWIGPVEFRGPAITLNVTEVDEVPYGTPPEVNLTARAGGYDLAFDIPRGMIIEPGTTTTLAPDQPAEVTFVPVTGGYRLDIAIPRGPTGDIDGVTPFWVSRLGADTDAAAARVGLGAISATEPMFTLAANSPRLVFSKNGSTQTDLLVVNDNEFQLRVFAPDAAQLRRLTARYQDNSLSWDGSEIYRRANLVGTVSQSGGFPTGAVMERGANANGQYVRYADGTQICWHRVGSIAVDQATPTLPWGRWSGAKTWSFPAQFISIPSCSICEDYALITPQIGCSLTSSASYALFYSVDVADRAVGLTAIGRWF